MVLLSVVTKYKRGKPQGTSPLRPGKARFPTVVFVQFLVRPADNPLHPTQRLPASLEKNTKKLVLPTTNEIHQLFAQP